ncbi:MAG TPA: Na/Pi symporter, partial [Thiotrichales bacterium]|nr:Na/Pi symporter [Thiotrichales bacterium]
MLKEKDMGWQSIGLLLGGLGLFLYGLEVFSKRLKANAGEPLRRLLLRMTATRWHGLVVGTVLTALLQSSSVLTVLTVGLVEAGMISFAQSLAIIIGSNIGSTLTLQLMVFKVTDIAVWLIFFGSLTLMFWRWQNRYVAELILALGLIFLGLNLMADAMRPLQETAWMQSIISWMDSIWTAALVGIVVTALIQSSAAFGGIVLALVLADQVDMTTAIAMMLGANIGTCITIWLASIGKGRETIRVALFHTLFNVIGATIVLLFLDAFIQFIHSMSSSDQPSILLANAHTLFNVVVAGVFILLVPQLVTLIRWLLPDSPHQVPAHDPLSISTPETANEGLVQGNRLIAAMGEALEQMTRLSVDMPRTLSQMHMLQGLQDELKQLDQRLLVLMSVTGRLAHDEASERQILRQIKLSSRLRTMGHLMGSVIPNVYVSMQKEKLVMSDATSVLYSSLQHRIGEQLQRLLLALSQPEKTATDDGNLVKKEMRLLREQLEFHHSKRLSAPDDDRVPVYVHESMLLDAWMQLAYVTRHAWRLLPNVDTPEKPQL